MIAHLIRRILSTLSPVGARILNPGAARRGCLRGGRCPSPPGPARPPLPALRAAAGVPVGGTGAASCAGRGGRGRAAQPPLAPGPTGRTGPGDAEWPAGVGCPATPRPRPPVSFPRSETQRGAEREAKRPRRRPRHCLGRRTPAARPLRGRGEPGCPLAFRSPLSPIR